MLKLWLDLLEEKSLKQRMDFQQSHCKKVLKLWLDLEDKKSLKQRMDFQQSQWKERAETIARFGRRKKFETTDGFPIIPVQKKCRNYGKIWKKKKV